MPNNIIFCGDPHGCFANVISTVHKYRPEAVILLRDYNLEIPLENYLQAIIQTCDTVDNPTSDAGFMCILVALLDHMLNELTTVDACVANPILIWLYVIRSG